MELQKNLDFNFDEAKQWGLALRHACQLVKCLTSCDRVYTISFGEGAQHLHLHLIPRFVDNSDTTSWKIADYYRDVLSSSIPAAASEDVFRIVDKARALSKLGEKFI